MSKLGQAIAEFNEQHGITGLKLGRHHYTNDQIRYMPYQSYTAQVDLYAAAYRGCKLHRPNGKVRYEVIGTRWNKFANSKTVLVRQTETGKEYEYGLKELKTMVVDEVPHQHIWGWVETELFGNWAVIGRKHYQCRCGAWKAVDPQGEETITLPEECQ